MAKRKEVEVSGSDKNQHKIQFIFSPNAHAALKRLKDRIGATSQADAVRYAIDLVLQFADEIDKGAEVCLKTNEGVQRVLLPFLSIVRRVPPENDGG